MLVKVSSLEYGASFRTTLTGRLGSMLGLPHDNTLGVRVSLMSGSGLAAEKKYIHPEVMVEPTEDTEC